MIEPRNSIKFRKADDAGSMESNIIVNDNDELAMTSLESKSKYAIQWLYNNLGHPTALLKRSKTNN